MFEVDCRPSPVGAWLVAGLAVAVPWLTWWPLTTGDLNRVVTETPIFLSGIGFLLVLCAWVAERDVWLALLVGYLAIRVFPLTSPYAFESAYLGVLAACALVTLQRTPAGLLPRIKHLLLIGGALQVGYGLLQWFGHDPLWIPWEQAVDQGLHIRGTVGNRNFFGAYAAICLVLGPVWLMPWFLVGLLLAKSVTPLVACAVGLAVRYQATRWALHGAWLVFVGALVWAYVRRDALVNFQYRLDVWAYALHDWWTGHPLIGMGTGAWPLRIPQAQLDGKVSAISHAVFVAAHNDWLQLLYEGGVIGAALLGAWLWTHRTICLTASGGAVAVVAVNALGNFPFHVGTTGLLALVVLGLACAESRAVPVRESVPVRRSRWDAWTPLEAWHP